VPDEQSMQPVQPSEPVRSMEPMHTMNGRDAIGHLYTQTSEWYRALPLCHDVVPHDDGLADKIALEIAKLRTARLAGRPMAHVDSEPAEVSATEAKEPATAEGEDRNDAVVQLAGALRTAERAHRAYLAELGQGDVEPVEDWSTWYAEYLLGLR
jgi:hypothetical protein